MPLFARTVFGLVDWAARKGLTDGAIAPGAEPAKQRARRTGVRGETYAYWYLRRLGYVMIARNYSYRGLKGEIDLVGYDGATLVFVEVKTRTMSGRDFGTPEDAVTQEKQRHLARVARQFLREYRIPELRFRFDVLAVEAFVGQPPVARLHKGAFTV